MLKSPVRINLGGGWSDQTEWSGTKAVVNAAIGWNDADSDDPHPLRIDHSGFHSRILGIGTGLGISSIYAAMEYLRDNPNSGNDYISHVLAWERQNGTKGGWQDQIGAIAPGFKLIRTEDHTEFTIERRDNHPVFQHLLLFDSGIRRPSKAIGDQVRELFQKSKSFKSALEQNVKDAIDTFSADAKTAANAYLAGWKRLTSHVPSMELDLPNIDGTWGHMFVGAGGGGFGLYFVREPDSRDHIAKKLSQYQLKGAAHKLQVHLPVLLPGIQAV